MLALALLYAASRHVSCATFEPSEGFLLSISRVETTFGFQGRHARMPARQWVPRIPPLTSSQRLEEDASWLAPDSRTVVLTMSI